MPTPKDNKLKQLYQKRPTLVVGAIVSAFVLMIAAVIASCFALRIYIEGKQYIESQRPEKSLRIFTTDVEVSSVELTCADQQEFKYLVQNPDSWNAWESYYVCGPQIIRISLQDGEQVLIGFYGDVENTRFRDIAILPSLEEYTFRLLDYRRLFWTIEYEEPRRDIWYKLLYEGVVISTLADESAEPFWIGSVR